MRTLDGVVFKLNKKSVVIKLENGLQLNTALLESTPELKHIGQRLRVAFDFTRREIKNIWKL